MGDLGSKSHGLVCSGATYLLATSFLSAGMLHFRACWVISYSTERCWPLINFLWLWSRNMLACIASILLRSLQLVYPQVGLVRLSRLSIFFSYYEKYNDSNPSFQVMLFLSRTGCKILTTERLRDWVTCYTFGTSSFSVTFIAI